MALRRRGAAAGAVMIDGGCALVTRQSWTRGRVDRRPRGRDGQERGTRGSSSSPTAAGRGWPRPLACRVCAPPAAMGRSAPTSPTWTARRRAARCTSAGDGYTWRRRSAAGRSHNVCVVALTGASGHAAMSPSSRSSATPSRLTRCCANGSRRARSIAGHRARTAGRRSHRLGRPGRAACRRRRRLRRSDDR